MHDGKTYFHIQYSMFYSLFTIVEGNTENRTKLYEFNSNNFIANMINNNDSIGIEMERWCEKERKGRKRTSFDPN